MCGIAGYMAANGKDFDADVLGRLADCLGHRGPDGRGEYRAPGVGMVQNRLAIIDLKTGDQPFYLNDGRGGWLALVANGEIYNYIELRREFGEENFSTRSDCEPPLHLYRREDVRFAEALRGMYAIAIHDPVRKRMLLARDPFGIKPLYYVETPLGFAFASEAQALVRAGLVKPKLNPRARDELLQLQFTTGRETAFAGVLRVLPGETLVVERGRVVARRQREALPSGPRLKLGEAEAIAELDSVLRDSVLVHQRSDVPYAMFLSGGVDSSALLALMRDLNESPVTAFTAGFSGTNVPDERTHAEAVATAAGARFRPVEFSEADFWHLLPEIVAAIDDPAADYAVLPSYKLAREAREAGFKVVLCGEGGDELFAGYGRYRRAARWWFPFGRAMRAKGAFATVDVLREPLAEWRSGIAAAEEAQRGGGRTAVQVAQAVDCVDWLPHDLLIKLDRCLMAHGVEGRTPFLDPKVAAFAYRLSDDLKIRRRLGKWLLRRWLNGKLPEAQAFSRKRGFTVPVAEWIAKRGKALGPLVAAQPGVEEICKPGAVEALYGNLSTKAGQAPWNLLFYALWHRRHIQGMPPAGDVFSTLGQK